MTTLLTNPTISVVICAYTEGRWDELLAAIASVQEQERPAHEIIVAIDNNPRLLDRLREWVGDAPVRVIENSDAPGLSGARNSGIAIASGAIVAFLDDDAQADPDWLARLAERFAERRVLGVGGSISPRWEGERPAWFPEEFYWVFGCTYRGLPRKTAPVRNLIGANMAFRRELFTSLGGFRTGFGQVGGGMLRCDDTEFCLKVRRERPGSVILYEPGAHVRHFAPASRANPRYMLVRCFTEGRAKALIASLMGAGDGLSSERAYTFRTLPLGVLRGLGDGFLRFDPLGFVRAATIVGALGVTTAGYLYETARLRARQLNLPAARPALRDEAR
jgi:GT2 family glycosyltransferase